MHTVHSALCRIIDNWVNLLRGFGRGAMPVVVIMGPVMERMFTPVQACRFGF